MTDLPTTLQAQMVAGLLNARLASSSGLRTWNGSDPLRRLAVHQNNVLSSLVEALADTFPVVQQLVGEEFFRGLAATFVRAEPPRTPILAFYGSRFPTFVAGFPPAASVPFLSDVARLEWLRVQSFHAEDAVPIGADAIHVLAGEAADLDRLRLALHPSVRLFESPFAAVSIWASHHGAGALEEVDVKNSEQALVLRQGLEVVILPADPSSIAFVRSVLSEEPLGTALECAAAQATDFDVVGLLATLLHRGAVTALEPC